MNTTDQIKESWWNAQYLTDNEELNGLVQVRNLSIDPQVLYSYADDVMQMTEYFNMIGKAYILMPDPTSDDGETIMIF